MIDDEQQSDPPSNFALSKAIRAVDGFPYWWRDKLDQIEADLNSSQSGRKDTILRLIEVIKLVNDAQADSAKATDPGVKEGLERHLGVAVKEVFELAEKLGLPLARAIEDREAGKPPRGNSR